MAAAVRSLQLEDAFPDAPLLRQEILEHISRCPQASDLFQRVSQYIIDTKKTITEETNGPAAKRRKLENTHGVQIEMVSKATLANQLTIGSSLLRLADVSFSIPQRKKFTLVITAAALGAINAKNDVEFGTSWSEVDYIACVPVPEKATRQWSFCVFPRNSHGISDVEEDPILFTIAESPTKGHTSGENGGDLKTKIIEALNDSLSIGVSEPSSEFFKSLAVNSSRKNDVSYHVKAHLGTKEGFLFFMENAIIWGFKKPLYCFLFDSIESSSYSSITQRTFSLTIRTTDRFGAREVEFSMIDQVEHPAIDGFLRQNHLKDASMAEARRAKVPPSLIKESLGTKSELRTAENEIAGVNRGLSDDDDDDDDDDDYEDQDSDSDRSAALYSDSDTDSASKEQVPSRNLAEEELGSELEDVDITDSETEEERSLI